ncbi:MAG: (4Fe-4S)-binding protein [Acidimicrobiales bacterium]
MADDAESVVVVLNAEVCIGVGNCELLQPDHFRIDDDTAVAELIGDGAMSREAAEEVVDRCPSGALSIATPSDR